MLGAAMGLVAGALMLLCLYRLVDAVCRGRRAPWWLALLQPLLIMAGLLPCAFLVPDQLVWDGTTMVAVLVLGALARIFSNRRRSRSGDAEKEEKEAKR